MPTCRCTCAAGQCAGCETSPRACGSNLEPAGEPDRFDRFRLIGWWDQEKLARGQGAGGRRGGAGQRDRQEPGPAWRRQCADRRHGPDRELQSLPLGSLPRRGQRLLQSRCRRPRRPRNLSRDPRQLVRRQRGSRPGHGRVPLGGRRDRRPGQPRSAARDQPQLLALQPALDRRRDRADPRHRRASSPPTARATNARCRKPTGGCSRPRRSCNLLSREQMQTGHTPTTPTISSIIAGVQCQEAVKLLHGLATIQGRGCVFDGLSTESYQTEFQRKQDCYSHEILEEIVPLDRRVRRDHRRPNCSPRPGSGWARGRARTRPRCPSEARLPELRPGGNDVRLAGKGPGVGGRLPVLPGHTAASRSRSTKSAATKRSSTSRWRRSACRLLTSSSRERAIARSAWNCGGRCGKRCWASAADAEGLEWL